MSAELARPVVLASKLQAPTPRADAVDRTVLIAALESAPDRALRAIVAPTGWGKSQLVAQWLSVHSRPVAYVALDAMDNDAARCWTHILTAVSNAASVEVDDLLDTLRAPALALVTEIVEPLLDRVGPTPMTIVLEDLHGITSADVLESLESLIDAAPATTTMAIVSRSEPAVHLPRRRVTGELVEIRLEDLRMTAAGAAAIVEGTTGSSLDDSLIGQLVARTEGWPAGIYLAALSLRRAPDAGSFVKEFAGDDRMLSEYLASEVLANFDEHERDFLLGTAVLSELEAGLCDEVLGTTDSARRLEEISRTNLFMIPTDQHAGRFRYHHLFGQWLQLELDRTTPTALGAAHRRAAEAYARRDDMISAVDHALESGDVEYAFTLLVGCATKVIDSGNHRTVSWWVSRLPRQLSPDMTFDLSVLRAWLGIVDGDLDTIDRNCRAVRQALEDDTISLFGMASVGEIDLIEGYAHLLRGSLDATMDAVNAAQAAGVSDRTGATLTWLEAATHYWLGVPDEQELLTARAQFEDVLDPYGVVLAEAYLANMALDRLDLEAAKPWVERLFATASANGLTSFGHLALGHVARSRLAMMNGDGDGAVRDGERAIELAERRGDSLVACLARTVLAEAHHSADERGAARTQLKIAGDDLALLTNPGILTERLSVAERQLRLPPRTTQLRNPDAPIEDLTDREMALLRLLPGDLSQRELGDVLFVSLNTVKTYNRQIYRKLGVASRDDAVATARAVGLLY